MGMDLSTAAISMHERDAEGNWQQILSSPGFVGRNGLCDPVTRKEGCGQTPTGIYRFNKAFGISPDPGCAIPYQQVTDDDYWSGVRNVTFAAGAPAALGCTQVLPNLRVPDIPTRSYPCECVRNRTGLFAASAILGQTQNNY